MNGSTRLLVGLDESYAGISNQLMALQNVLCMAKPVGVHAVSIPFLGYTPGTIHSGSKKPRPQNESRDRLLALLTFREPAQAMLERGSPVTSAPIAQREGWHTSVLCNRFQTVRCNSSCCKQCTPYTSKGGLQCLSKIAAQWDDSKLPPTTLRVFFDRAFQVRPANCYSDMLQDVLGVTPLVEQTAEWFMERLGLSSSRPYVAVQYRVGPDQRFMDAEEGGRGAACYGPQTIEHVLTRLGLAGYERFVMSNHMGSKTLRAWDGSSAPEALRLVVESLIASRAIMILLNKHSTIMNLIRRLSRAQDDSRSGLPVGTVSKPRIRFVAASDVIDACSCNSTSAANARWRGRYKKWCSDPSEFARPSVPRCPAPSDFLPSGLPDAHGRPYCGLLACCKGLGRPGECTTHSTPTASTSASAPLASLKNCNAYKHAFS